MAETTPPPRIGILAYVAAFSFAIYQLVVQTSYSPLREEIGADLALDAMRTSVVSASFLLIYACMQIPAGLLLDRFGATRLLPVATLLLGGATVLFSLSGSMATAIAGRGLMGISAAFAFPAIGLVLRRGVDVRWFPFLMGLADVGIGVGGMIGTLGADRLAAAIGWRGTMQVAAAFALPIAITAAFLLPKAWFGARTAAPAATAGRGSLRQVIASRDVRLAALIYAGGCGTMYGFGTMWNRPIAIAWTLDPQEAAIIDFAFYLGLALGAPFTGIIEGRLGARRTMLWGLGLTLAAFLTWVLVPVWWTIWFDAANVALIGAGLASTVLAFTVACRSLPKELAGTAVGFVNFAGVVTGAALQVVPGLVGEWLAMDPLFELQVGSGTIFTIALTLAIVATMRLPRDHAAA